MYHKMDNQECILLLSSQSFNCKLIEKPGWAALCICWVQRMADGDGGVDSQLHAARNFIYRYFWSFWKEKCYQSNLLSGAGFEGSTRGRLIMWAVEAISMTSG
jgi:hypothetical protein